MRYQEKITKAKAKLMLEHPYFGTIASALKMTPDSKQLTFKSDGVSLFLNEAYMDKLSVDEMEFVLANGAMHAVLKHQERKAGRDRWLWQEAGDFAINAMLAKNGMRIPEYVNYQPQFEGMYAEEIYAVLKDEMKYRDDTNHASQGEEQESHEANDTQSTQETPPQNNPTPPTQQSQLQKGDSDVLEELKLEMSEQFEQIFQKLNRQGTLPKALEFVIPEQFSHSMDWRELLYGYIASYAKSTYAFSPPNMKYLYRGIYLPALSSDMLRIAVAIDTSGSIDQRLLTTFLGEVNSIMQSYPNYEIDLITADAKVQSHRVFLPGEALDYEVSGGGGTDFRPVFTYIDQHLDYPTLLLYFTDGMGTFPQDEPSYDVMWVMPHSAEVPFGEVLVLG